MAKKHKTIWIGIMIIAIILALLLNERAKKEWNLVGDDTNSGFCVKREPVREFEVKLGSFKTKAECVDACANAVEIGQIGVCFDLV